MLSRLLVVISGGPSPLEPGASVHRVPFQDQSDSSLSSATIEAPATGSKPTA
jgi:hypothetical protein